jgi:4'-phosphopantetheinyl transferase
MQRLVRQSSREQFLLSRSLRRLVLSAMCPAVPPHTWKFEVTAAGKPFVQGGGPLFSCSHTDGLVACLVDLRGAQRLGVSEGVGIDVEYNNPQRRTAELAQAVLSLREQKILLGHTDTYQTELFYRLWTLKEAYLKALGLGLHQEPQKVELALQPATEQGLHWATVQVAAAADILPKQQWRLLSFKLRPDSPHLVALALRSATPLEPKIMPVLLHAQLPAEK